MGIFANRADRKKFMQEFLNDLIAQGILSAESGKKDIANGKAGCYLSKNHGLPLYSSIGVSDTNSFLRFWEKEYDTSRKKKIQKRKLFLEENVENIKKILGSNNIHCSSYNQTPIRGYDVEEYDDKFNGFCVFFDDRKSKETLKVDLQKMSKVLKLFMENENVSIDKKKITNNKKNKTNVSLRNIELNTILYGPPGTGKTFNAMAYAVAICDKKDVEEIKKEMRENYDSVKQRYDSLKDEGRIEFVTFHQSYGYEDFIEGIKPDLDDSTGMLKYKLETGRFKAFCDKISGNFEEAWGVLCDKLDDEDKEYLEIPYISDKSKTFAIEWNVSHNGLKAKDAHRFFNKKQLQNIYRKKPGVKKGGHDNYRKAIVEYMKKECGLKEFNGNESNDLPSNARVFIIDEINRGNISKIFGELITLIEPSKRLGQQESIKVTLPYSGDEFGVPNNVYILGTMNTADRSIAMMDTALRRRFNFVEMMPDTSELSPLKDKKIEDKGVNINICEMLKTINERIKYLYDREHTIGHAFFVNVKRFDDLKLVFKNKVIPLLQEYFYDDYEKIRLVLGDNGKDEIHQFIRKNPPEKNLFKMGENDEYFDTTKNTYSINEDAFENIESYKGII